MLLLLLLESEGAGEGVEGGVETLDNSLLRAALCQGHFTAPSPPPQGAHRLPAAPAAG